MTVDPRHDRVGPGSAGTVDIAALAAELTGALREIGLPDPRVEVEVVDGIERRVSGKLKRFVPLG